MNIFQRPSCEKTCRVFNKCLRLFTYKYSTLSEDICQLLRILIKSPKLTKNVIKFYGEPNLANEN
jgi:hypothetical protein